MILSYPPTRPGPSDVFSASFNLIFFFFWKAGEISNGFRAVSHLQYSKWQGYLLFMLKYLQCRSSITYMSMTFPLFLLCPDFLHSPYLPFSFVRPTCIMLKYIPHKADVAPIYLLIKHSHSGGSKYFLRGLIMMFELV